MPSGDNEGCQRGKNAFERMTPEQRAENGRKGAKKANENRRKRKEMRETLDVLLKMPMRKGKAYSAEDIKCFADLKGSSNR